MNHVDDAEELMYGALVRARPGDHGMGPEEIVAALLRRPAWHARAVCRGVGAAVFFPERGQRSDTAKQICAGCVVAAECALAGQSEGYGVWAGMSPGNVSSSGRRRRRRSSRDQRWVWLSQGR